MDASEAKPFQVLVDLCEQDGTPADVRKAASEALSRQIILPHTKIPEASRRRGVKALVSVIKRGKASPIVIIQCSGMAPFIDKADVELVQRAKKEQVPANFNPKTISIPYK